MKSPNAYALLGLLTIKPMTGYEMKKWVDEILSNFWKTSYGQIYPTMQKCVEEKLVTVEKLENENSPASKQYSITDKGMGELKTWLEIDVFDFNYRDETLLKFYFSSLLPIETVIAKAEKTVAYHEAIAAGYEEMGFEMKLAADPSRQEVVRYLAVKKGVYLNEARTKWAEECIRVMTQYEEKENKKQEEEHGEETV